MLRILWFSSHPRGFSNLQEGAFEFRLLLGAKKIIEDFHGRTATQRSVNIDFSTKPPPNANTYKQTRGTYISILLA